MFEPAKLEPFPPELRWRYIPIRAGSATVCWVLGPQVPCQTHYDMKAKRTQPCRAWASGGKLPCALGDRCRPRLISYLPVRIFRGDDRAVIILSRTPALAAREVLHQGTCLCLARDMRANNPPLKWKLLVGTDDPAPAITGSIRQGKPCDIRPYLLHLWQDEPLTRLLGGDFRPSPNTLDQSE